MGLPDMFAVSSVSGKGILPDSQNHFSKMLSVRQAICCSFPIQLGCSVTKAKDESYRGILRASENVHQA
jgi:hypothetical protein